MEHPSSNALEPALVYTNLALAHRRFRKFVACQPSDQHEHHRSNQNGCMIVRVLVILTFCTVCFPARAEETNAEGWSLAVPGYQITFPLDHLPHYGFRTEWWYFTVNLQGKDGREFGYQVTFFRYGYRPPRNRVPVRSRFVMDDLKFAHFAVTDISKKKFYYDSRISRGAFGEAGFGNGNRLAWIDNWEVSYASDFHLHA